MADTPRPADVETAARAFYDHGRGTRRWEGLPDFIRQDYLDAMTAALRAAGLLATPPAEGGCICGHGCDQMQPVFEEDTPPADVTEQAREVKPLPVEHYGAFGQGWNAALREVAAARHTSEAEAGARAVAWDEGAVAAQQHRGQIDEAFWTTVPNPYRAAALRAGGAA